MSADMSADMSTPGEIAPRERAMLDCNIAPRVRMTFTPGRRAGDRWVGYRRI
jgi:hypothetical protein